MAKLFEHLDHRGLIVPKEVTRNTGNKIKTLIGQYFNDVYFLLKEIAPDRNENLLFSLVEAVALNIRGLPGIGDIYVYSNYDQDTDNRLMIDYRRMLEDFGKTNHYVTDFASWYDHESFYLEMINAGESQNDFEQYGGEYKWSSLGHYLEEQEGGKNQDPIEESTIHNYLTDYANRVIPLFGLKKYPYALIVLKPITLEESRLRRPIGNLFFHLGLKEKISQAQLSNFLNLFELIWIKQHWRTIFHKFKEEDSRQELKDDPSYYNYNIEKISDARKIYGSNSINDFVVRFFRTPSEGADEFTDQVHNEIFPDIIQALMAIKLKKERNNHEMVKWVSPSGWGALKKGYDAELVKKFIVQHLITVTGLVLFDLHFSQIIPLVRSQEWGMKGYLKYRDMYDTAKLGDLKDVLQNKRFVYLGKYDVDQKHVIHLNLIRGMSSFEVDVFKQYYLKGDSMLVPDMEQAEETLHKTALKTIQEVCEMKLRDSNVTSNRHDKGIK